MGRFEITRDSNNLTVLLKKSDIPATALAQAVIYFRVYQKAPGTAGDELDTRSLTKGSETTQDGIIIMLLIQQAM